MVKKKRVQPGKLTWNLEITQLKRNIIFQTSMFRLHVSFRGVIHHVFLMIGFIGDEQHKQKQNQQHLSMEGR